MARDKFEKLLYNGDEGTEGLFTGDLELMGTWEVARYLGVEKSRIARWLSEGQSSIEPPAARLKAGPVWRREQVRRKAAQMYEAANSEPPKSDAVLERWLRERRERRERRAEASEPVAA